MERLSTLLKQHQIKSGALKILYPTAQEKSYVLPCEGTAAFPRWQRLRSLVTQTGYWPVILGDVDIDLDSYGTSMHALLEESQTIDITKWVKEGDVERALVAAAQERSRLAEEGGADEEEPWIQGPLEGFLPRVTQRDNLK